MSSYFCFLHLSQPMNYGTLLAKTAHSHIAGKRELDSVVGRALIEQGEGLLDEAKRAVRTKAGSALGAECRTQLSVRSFRYMKSVIICTLFADDATSDDGRERILERSLAEEAMDSYLVTNPKTITQCIDNTALTMLSDSSSHRVACAVQPAESVSRDRPPFAGLRDEHPARARSPRRQGRAQAGPQKNSIRDARARPQPVQALPVS